MRIVFFDIDCLRPDHLGCYGYNRPTSPTIDGIASEGRIFTRYYCASSPCLPSRTSLISGRFGIRNGVCSNVSAGSNFFLREKDYGGPKDDNEFFQRNMRKGGMGTISISNFADRHSAYYFMAGWSEFYTVNLKGGDETAEEVNQVALKWIDDNKCKDDFFLHINYWDTHRCYKMDPRWRDKLKGTKVKRQWPDEDTIKKHQSIPGPFTASHQFRSGKSPYELMPDSISCRKDFEHMLDGYDTSIAYVDYHVGQIIDKLKEHGMWEDTAVIISSDHGDAFGEHGIYSDHVCADECIHNIPLIVRWPGQLEPGECDSLLYNTDLPPTVCDMLGIDIPGDWDGKSFANQLKGKRGEERDYLVWDHGLYAVQRAVRTIDHLLIKTYDDMGYGFEDIALYDMNIDKYQTRNIAGDYPEVVNDCIFKMDEWLKCQINKGHVINDPLFEVIRERDKRQLFAM